MGKTLTSILPALKNEEIADQEQVTHFVSCFLRNDAIVQCFLDKTAYLIFNQGYRPWGNFNKESESAEEDFPDLESWFTIKIFRDLNSLRNANRTEFERFLDILDERSVEALLEAGSIAIKYDILPQNYHYESELNKITDPDEKAQFKRHLLTDRVLEAEIRILSHLFYHYFGKCYSVKT